MGSPRRCEIRLLAMLLAAVILPCRAEADEPLAGTPALRAVVLKSLPLLQTGAKTFRERSEGRCISCHHQGLVLQTVALARQRGFAVDESLAKEEVDRVHGFYARRQSRYLAALTAPSPTEQADPFGNFTVHAGYWLWGLAAEQVPPDDATQAAVRLLAASQAGDGHWTFTDVARAPMQSGDITTTALAALALRNYAAAEVTADKNRQLEHASRWLLTAQPRTTDDKAYRLLGLFWLDQSHEARRKAANLLLADQRHHGGWAQQANMPADAYATGLALVALATAGELPIESEAWRRGVEFLVKSQHPDGSWFVKTRAIPTNPYFESGFPHGKSQFISYAATCWATQALLLSQ